LIYSGVSGGWEVLRKAFPICVLLLVKNIVDIFAVLMGE
jgi:hypothetical protein